MLKIKSGLLDTVGERLDFEAEQQALKEKHQLEGKDVVVIETDNNGKFAIRTLGTIFRYFCTIILIILAAVGIMALVYPVPREGLNDVFTEIFKQLGI